MKMKWLTFVIAMIITLTSQSQDLPLREIPAYPESYSEGTVLARFTEGLGYRYYWATEGLKQNDLNFKPSEDARTTFETIVHLYGLSRFIHDTVHGNTIRQSREYTRYSFEELRKETLEMLAETSNTLRNENFTHPDIMFPANDAGQVTTFPYWHLMNGPISDALYHTGQVVSFRRSSGNPMNPGVSVLTGRTKE